MYQYDDPSGVAVRPTSTAPGVPSYPTDGNPVTNSPPSIARAEWFCAIMDELMNLTAAGGVAPSKTAFNQLVKSLAVLTSGATQNLVDTSTVVNAMVATATLPVSNPTPGTLSAIASYQRGLMATITPAITNTSAAVTLTINGLGPLPFVRSDGAPPQPGDLVAGRPVRIYGTGTQFVLLAPTASQLGASFGIAAVNVAGNANVVLTPAQYGLGIVVLTGLLTGNVTVTFPASGSWVVSNQTTGAFTVTCKTAAGNGSPVAQGKNLALWGDGTNLQIRLTDIATVLGYVPAPLASPALTGTPTAPTPPPGDNSTKLATTAFVVSSLPTQLPFGGAPNAIVAASHTYAAADASKSSQRSNAGAAMIDILPGATAGALPAGWSGTVVNTDAVALLALTVGAGSVLKGSGVVNGMLVLGPGQLATIACDGTNYAAWGSQGRAKLAAPLALNVSPSGSDATGTGLTAASAFATPMHAYSWAQAALDLNLQPLTINLVAGNFTSYSIFSGPLVGQAGAPAVNGLVPVIFNGAGAANTSVSSSSAATGSFLATNGAVIQVQNMSCGQTGAAGQCLLTTGIGTNIIVGPGMVFTATTLAHMDATSDRAITILDSYTISGGAQVHWLEAYNGKIYFAGGSGLTLTLTGTPAFSGAFASAVGGGIITPLTNSTIPTFVGTATGPKYAVSNGAIINTNGAGVSAFPGSTAGSGTGYF